jgi:protein-S-isoprenylcysteine O-methyltransferase Ste14
VKINAKQKVLLALLAIVFTIGLTCASFELPLILNELLHYSFDFPDDNPVLNPELLETFILSNHLHLIGYGALILLLVLVIVGLFAEKRGLATTGAIGFFLPVFGHFCMSMFFLAGLGLLRIIWMPITDVSFDLLRLGDIVYLPYAVIVYFFALIGVDVRGPLPYIIMGFGILVFVLGVLVWFITRFQRREAADFWVYRFSRHPQYLGWILWSYGLTIYFARHHEGTLFKQGTWSFSDSLPFLLSAVVITGVALIEEIKMRRDQGQEYEVYCQRTSFMLPLPRFVSNVTAAPLRFVLKKERPETGKEVAIVLAVYAGLLILLSVPFVVFQWPPESRWARFPYNVFPFK